MFASVVFVACASEADLPDEPSPRRVEEHPAVAAAFEHLLNLRNDAIGVSVSASERACILDDGQLDGIDLSALPEASERVDERVSFIDVVLRCVGPPYEDLVAADLLRVLGVQEDETLPFDVGRCIVDRVVASSEDPARLFVVHDGPSDADVIIDAVERCIVAPFGRDLDG